jgi:hypothetical protein
MTFSSWRMAEFTDGHGFCLAVWAHGLPAGARSAELGGGVVFVVVSALQAGLCKSRTHESLP